MITMKLYYGDGTEYSSYGDALSSWVMHLVLVVVAFSTLLSAIYHYFIKKTISTSMKYVTICLILTLTFNVLFCIATALRTTYGVLNKKPLTCALSVSHVPLISIARLFLYLYFVARYVDIFNKQFKNKTS